MTRLTVSALCLLTVCLWASPARSPGSRCRRGRSAGAYLSRRRRRVLERDGRTETRPGFDAAAGRRSAPHPGRTGRGPVRRRQRAAPRRQQRGRLPVRRGRAAARGPGAAERRRAGRAICRTASMPRRPGCRSARRANTASASSGSDGSRARGPARQRRARQRAGTQLHLAPASGRSPVPARPPRPPTSSTPPRGTPSIAGRRLAAISGSACRRSTCRTTCVRMRRRSTPMGPGGTSRSYGYVWYPRVSVGWRPYHRRPLGQPAPVRLDLDWRRPLGLADASLRPLGLLRRRRGSGFPGAVGAGVGVVGLRARLRELVPARLEQPPGLRR